MFLKDVPQQKLQGITDKTAEIFDRLYRNAAADKSNAINERVMIFLTMRFNRRIMQNAGVCRQDVLKQVPPNSMQSTNYRWMLLQPFITIDREAVAVLTDQQVNMMMEMAAELPRLLVYVDGKDNEQTSEENIKKLEGVLCEYFLTSYLKSIL